MNQLNEEYIAVKIKSEFWSGSRLRELQRKPKPIIISGIAPPIVYQLTSEEILEDLISIKQMSMKKISSLI